MQDVIIETHDTRKQT